MTNEEAVTGIKTWLGAMRKIHAKDDFATEFIEAAWHLAKLQLQTADAAPIVHGHWIKRNEGDPMLLFGECSVCGYDQSISHYLNYCPHCGAKMYE